MRTHKRPKIEGIKIGVLQNFVNIKTQTLMYCYITRCAYLRVDDKTKLNHLLPVNKTSNTKYKVSTGSVKILKSIYKSVIS